jgi:hypothetical protein
MGRSRHRFRGAEIGGAPILKPFIAWYMRRQASLQNQLTNIAISYSFVRRGAACP